MMKGVICMSKDKHLHFNLKCPYDGLSCDHFIGDGPACSGVTFFGFGHPEKTVTECPRNRDEFSSVQQSNICGQITRKYGRRERR